ncbi:MAG: HAD family hydrolase [Hespellia sp.]|nr:HAD family hydrolase [Hespellia sp.]
MKFAIFDFDGTLSLIREGWQKVMKQYFLEVLRDTPEGKRESEKSLMECVDYFVDINTGKQTIYQCIDLVEECKKRNGEPMEALDYKDEYLRRLMKEIEYRIRGIEDGTIDPLEYTVPGSLDILRKLKERGVKIYVASGTDEEFARHEADILGVSEIVEHHVYGAQRDYKSFSKKMVIEQIIRDYHLQRYELVGFGDGFVEIENVSEIGGFAVGVATNEKEHDGTVDEWKRERLIRAGANIIIPDFQESERLIQYLFEEV